MDQRKFNSALLTILDGILDCFVTNHSFASPLNHAKSVRAEIRKLRRVVTKLVAAAIDEQWIGQKDPSDWPSIERRISLARKAYENLLKELGSC